MSVFPDFPAWFKAINGKEPFPWQSRLARRVAVGDWPDEIGVPTGLGKSSCIDIAVWALAAQAGRPQIERTAPTRIWYVVNRRLLVDAAYEHGVQVARKLQDSVAEEPAGLTPDQRVIRRVAEALQQIGVRKSGPHGESSPPLEIARLRGNAELGVRPSDPSQPALVFATVPMFASRWLFRGYGTSRFMRSVDAALAGVDSLVLLDEAHLARPLVQLSVAIAACDHGSSSQLLPGGRMRPRWVQLTATGGTEGNRFDLEEDDYRNKLVAQRMSATKPTSLLASSEKRLTRDIAQTVLEALQASPAPRGCVVFLNTPKRVREVREYLVAATSKAKMQAQILVSTGQARSFDTDALHKRLMHEREGVRSGREGSLDEHLVVLSTQTLEVGADLDFDVLVTETAGVRATIQRFGRLNRLGQKPDARAIVVHAVDGKPSPLYGDEIGHIWERLQRISGGLDLSPENIQSLLGDPEDHPGRLAEFLPAHLWELAKTSYPPQDETPIELFYDGFPDLVGRASVCWRAYLPEADGAGSLTSPIRQDEVIDLPIGQLKEALTSDFALSHVWVLNDDRLHLTRTPVSEIRPGNTVLLPCSVGGCDEFGWNPSYRSQHVSDVSFPDSCSVVVSANVVANLVSPAKLSTEVIDLIGRLAKAVSPPEQSDDDEGALPPEMEESVAELHDRVVKFLFSLEAPKSFKVKREPEQAWTDFISAMQVPVIALEAEGVVVWPVTIAKTIPGRNVRFEILDELSQAADGQETDKNQLHRHLVDVGTAAGAIASSLGMSAIPTDSVAEAGQLHDLGKLDFRFQQWLSPGGSDVPMAKSNVPNIRWESARVVSGWPRGGRHELLSGRLLQQYLQDGGKLAGDAELVVHLSLTHHGRGRPTVAVVEDDLRPEVVAEVKGQMVRVNGDLSRHDWDQPARFRRLCETYGYWGLALMEAIVRQADHVASNTKDVV